MDKKERKLIQFVELLRSKSDVEAIMAYLPKGYISTKTISGHSYSYLQWRDGNKIISRYVENEFLPGMKSKIKMRKDNENLLRVIKNDLKNVKRIILKNQYLTLEQVALLEANTKFDAVFINKKEVVEQYFPEYIDTPISNSYISGDISVNILYLKKWGLLS